MSVISSRLLAVAARAADLAMPAGIAAPKGDIENGQAIFSQRCGVCRAVSKEPGSPTAGPNLISPYTKVPGTIMPMLLPDDKERGDVIAYLATLKQP